MPAKRFNISIDSDLADVVVVRASASSEGVSARLAEAARRRIRQDELLGAVADFEREHGEITAKQLAASRRRLGIAASAAAKRSA